MEKEKGKGNVIYKKLRLLDCCKKTKLFKTLRVTTSNYRLFYLVDHLDKIPEII